MYFIVLALIDGCYIFLKKHYLLWTIMEYLSFMGISLLIHKLTPTPTGSYCLTISSKFSLSWWLREVRISHCFDYGYLHLVLPNQIILTKMQWIVPLTSFLSLLGVFFHWVTSLNSYICWYKFPRGMCLFLNSPSAKFLKICSLFFGWKTIMNFIVILILRIDQ